MADGMASISRVEGPKDVGDRQLDALLERLDRLTDELRGLNRRLDSGENLAPIVRELALLNDSLQALAYASLGQQGPQVRRRRTG
jgi:DNA-binding FrmR family transcriptional regulator